MPLEDMSNAELIDLVKLQEAALGAEQARYESLAQVVDLMDKGEEPGAGSDWHKQAKAALEMKNAIIAVISYGHLHDEAPTAKLARQLLGAIERDPRVAGALATHPASVAQVGELSDEVIEETVDAMGWDLDSEGLQQQTRFARAVLAAAKKGA